MYKYYINFYQNINSIYSMCYLSFLIFFIELSRLHRICLYTFKW